MAQLMEYADYLSKEIGPRPAGTEEEQQAALYITECFQKDAGFPAQIEEFTSTSNLDGIAAIPGLVIIVAAILGMIFPFLIIPAFIVAAVAAALFTAETMGVPLVTRPMARGASQNVVAKYQPNAEPQPGGRSRARKIVLVAHYDSGKVTPGLVRAVESKRLPLPIGRICVGGYVLAAIFMLLHIFINNGIGGIVINVLTVIALIVCAYPVLRAILYRAAPYNEGANNNASGTAALLEVARRISRGSVSEADLAENPPAGVVIHGENAARENDLVPEGAQIRYEAEQLVPPAEIGAYSDEERLLSAKAAIAALTGQPVERKVYGSAATKLVNSRAHDTEPADERFEQEPPASDYAEQAEVSRETSEFGAPAQAKPEPSFAPAPADEPASKPMPEPAPAAEQPAAPAVSAVSAEAPTEAEGFANAPSWFVTAQQNAKKPTGETGPIQRSRYAEAIEAAEREAAQREFERQAQARAQREAELKAREEAARAAIAGNGQAPTASSDARPIEAPEGSAPADEPAVEPELQAVPEPEPQAIPETEAAQETATDAAQEPAFVPYAEAHPEAAAQISERPAQDEFAASLGSTTAFDPRQLQLDDAGEPEGEPADQVDQAEQVEEGEQQPQNRLAGLPSITGGQAPAQAPAATPENNSPSRSGILRKLRTDVPSLSGVIRMQEAGEDVSQPPVQSAAPAPALVVPDPAAEPAPSAAPVAELAVEVAPAAAPAAESAAPAASAAETVDYDMAVNEGDYATDEGGAAGFDNRNEPQYDDRGRYGQYDDYDDYDDYADDEPEIVEPPKSRAGGLFSRFRRNKKRDELEDTPQEWLDVDDDFDARTVGRERGGWESFRDDSYDDYDDRDDRDDRDGRGGRDGRDANGAGRRRWEGGSYSRVRLGRVDTRSGEGFESDEPVEQHDFDEDDQIAGEIEQIYHFRNPLYNTEVWFVALGAEASSHDGVKAFMAEHADDLRGAMVIEVESLGAGELCTVTSEGRVNVVTASSRVKRYTRAATAATGIALGEVNLVNSDSAASLLQAAGYQAMHLAGVEYGRPALKGSPNDVLENVDDLLLDDNVNFLMELLKK